MKSYLFVVSHPQVETAAISLVGAASGEEAEAFLKKILKKSNVSGFNAALYDFQYMGTLSPKDISSMKLGTILMRTVDKNIS
jgi:hypothetical protein